MIPRQRPATSRQGCAKQGMWRLEDVVAKLTGAQTVQRNSSVSIPSLRGFQSVGVYSSITRQRRIMACNVNFLHDQVQVLDCRCRFL
jgi:hypothetical protein